MKVVKSLEESSLLIKSVSETGALTDKGVFRGVDGVITAIEGVIRAGEEQNFQWWVIL